jgi:hypothetical protein
MGALRSGHNFLGGARGARRREWSGAFQADRLATDHFQPRSPDAAPWPVTPKYRSRRGWCDGWIGRRRGICVRGGERPQDRTHPSRLERGPALLTLCPQQAGTAMTNARGIQEPQGTIAFGTPLLEIERMVRRATQATIGLRCKRGAGEAVRKGAARPLGRTIDDRRRRCCRRFRLAG